jgi:hypothetical protein
MNRARARRDILGKAPPIGEAQDQEWLGAEAHVRRPDRPFDWVQVFKTVGAGFTALSLGLAFLGGLVLGSTITSMIARGDKD